MPFPLEYDEDGKVSHRALNNVLTRHLTETPPAILPFRQAAYERTHPGVVYKRDYPEWLDQVVMKCLAKNPADRYADAKELLDEINSHQANDAKSSASDGEVEQLKSALAQVTSQWLSEKQEKERLSAKNYRSEQDACFGDDALRSPRRLE